MSKVTLIGDSLPNLLPSVDRSPGLHVSEIITSMCVLLGHFQPGGEDDLSTTWGQMGFAWERAIVDRYEEDAPGRYSRVPELCVDEIYLSPDLLDLERDEPVEIKASWMSSKHQPGEPKFWRYETQLKSYAWAMQCRSGTLNVTHVNGDWKGVGPQNRTWRYEFTKSELAENWALIRSHGRKMLKDGYVPEGSRSR